MFRSKYARFYHNQLSCKAILTLAMKIRSGGLRAQDCQISDNWPSFLSLAISEKRRLLFNISSIIARETEKMEKQWQKKWRGNYNILDIVDRCLARCRPRADANWTAGNECNTIKNHAVSRNTMIYHTLQCRTMQLFIFCLRPFFLKISLLDMLEHLKTRDQPARNGCGQYLNLYRDVTQILAQARKGKKSLGKDFNKSA